MKFAIVITSYNQPEYLNEAMNSAMSQVYKDIYQVIVVDDSDELKKNEWFDLKKENIWLSIIHNKKNLGLQKSYNIGCYNVKEDVEWIIRLDGDDKLLPSTLQDLSDFIDKQTDKKLAFIYSDLKIMNSKKIKIYPDWDETLFGLLNIGHLQAVKKSVSDELNHWDISLKYSADTDFLIRLLELGYRIKHIPKVLYDNRIHDEQYTQTFPKNNDVNYWKNLIFNRALQKRPELWPKSRSQVVMQTTGSYYWKSEVLAIKEYCRGNGLDLGCSNRKKFPFAIGVDINRQGGKIPELVWDSEKELPFRNETLDYILSCHLVEHLKDPAKAISMWLRKIKVGGYLILVVPHKAYIPNIGTKNGDPTHLHDFLPEGFKSSILSAVDSNIKTELISFDSINNNWSFDCVLRKI